MANPLYKQYGPQQQNNDLDSKFAQFASQFKGDPKAMVQQLLNSGRMTQEQYNYFSALADQKFHQKGGM